MTRKSPTTVSTGEALIWDFIYLVAVGVFATAAGLAIQWWLACQSNP